MPIGGDLVGTLVNMGMPFEDWQMWKRWLANIDAVSRQVGAIKIDGIAGLSEITENAGTILAGEFRSGNRELPGDGFSGVRIGYPGFTYDAETWNLAGINDDTLQVGFRASDGKFLAGGGIAILDVNGLGLHVPEGVSTIPANLSWYDSDGDVFIRTFNTFTEGTGKFWLIAGPGGATRNVHVLQIEARGGETRPFIVLNGIADISSIVLDNEDNAVEILQGETVFNQGGEDINFRVEGDTDQNLLFVDAGNEAVTIGSTTELAKLGVDGNADEVQFAVQAHSSQTANILEIEDSSANVLSGVDERGILFSDGGIDVNSVYIGDDTGNINHTNAVHNIGIGTDVLDSLTTGDTNIAIGSFVLDGATSASRNVAVGVASLGASNGNDNVALGYHAGYISQSFRGIYIGAYAGSRQTSLSDLLIIDNRERADAATELTNSILYGVMAAAPADQSLRINAEILGSDGAKIGDGGTTNYTQFGTGGEVTLVGSAKVYKESTFVFNYRRVTAQGAPTLVNRGVFFGFSLPVYDTDDEELFACICTPSDWDGTSDPIVYIGGWLDTANTSKKFNLQLSVETADYASNDVVPITTNDYATETTTGTWAQYTSFKSAHTIDASAVGLAVGQPLAIRIRRLDASADEIAGEVVVEGAMIQYVANKLGGAT